MIINVKCSFTIPVEIPDDPEWNPEFAIEENSCPGTGLVWSALSKHIAEHEEKSTCWACALGGSNEIVP